MQSLQFPIRIFSPSSPVRPSSQMLRPLWNPLPRSIRGRRTKKRPEMGHGKQKCIINASHPFLSPEWVLENGTIPSNVLLWQVLVQPCCFRYPDQDSGWKVRVQFASSQEIEFFLSEKGFSSFHCCSKLECSRIEDLRQLKTLGRKGWRCAGDVWNGAE